MAEQINKLAIIDETLNFISPEIIAESGSPEYVLPVLKLAKLALSVFHPDKDHLLDADEYQQAKGVQALTKINSLVKSFEADPELAQMFYTTSREIGEDSVDKIRTERGLLDTTIAIREQISVKPEALLGVNMQLEPTGETVEQKATQKLLAMVLGKPVISLIASAGKDNLDGVMPLLKKKLLKDIESPFGIDNQEWMAVFDEIQRDGHIDESQIISNQSGDLVSDDILESVIEERFHAFSTLLELIKPNEKLKYPENWYRSFSGRIVCPTSLRDWPRYENFTVLNHDVELRVFDVHEVEDGIVKSSARLDTGSRDSIELINNIEDTNQKKWVKKLINYVAQTEGYEPNKFTVKSSNTGANEPMDFIFEITEDNKVNIIYTRPRNEKSEAANKESIAFEDFDFPKNSTALEAGYYMVKAGKNSKTKKYAANPPLALIRLTPEYNDQLVGTAFIGGQSNIFTGESVLLSFSTSMDIEPDANELPALLGSKVGLEKERLFNIQNLFTGVGRESDNRQCYEALKREFINTGRDLYHLTFIDDGDYLGSSSTVSSNKTPGRVYSQTSLSGHRARLISDKTN